MAIEITLAKLPWSGVFLDWMRTVNKILLRIGTRSSALALWQAKWVKARLEHEWPDLQVELVPIKTSGDRIQDVSLATIGGKGLFVKEIEDALLVWNRGLGGAFG